MGLIDQMNNEMGWTDESMDEELDNIGVVSLEEISPETKLCNMVGVDVMDIDFALMQNGDTVQEGDQTLRIGIVEGGSGAFIVLKTERWAIDVEDLTKLTDMLKKMVNLANNK